MKQTKTEQAIRDAFAAVTPDRLDDILADCGKTSKGAIHMESNHINKTPRTAPARRPGRMAYLAAAAAALVIVLTGVLIGTIAFRGRTVESAAANASSDAATPMPTVSTAPVAAATSAPNPLAPTPQPAASSAADQNSASRAISPEEATQIATAHAGHPNAEAVVSRSKPSVYEIRFTVGGIDYEYEIDARTGKILDFEAAATSTPNPLAPTPQPAASSAADQDSASRAISPEEATQIATAHAGHPNAEAVVSRSKPSVYEIRFTVGGIDYEYEIDARTGKILDFEWERTFDLRDSSSVSSLSSDQVKEALTAVLDSTSPTLTVIVPEAALQAVAVHSGIPTIDIEGMLTKFVLDYDAERNEAVYEIEFTAEDTDYEYEIDAVTGKVREFDAEPARAQNPSSDKKTSGTAKPTAKPDSKSEATDIGASKAKSIALSQAGVSASDAKGLSCKAETENGRRVYDVEFKAGGYEYEYEIDAETGKILSRKKEKDD